MALLHQLIEHFLLDEVTRINRDWLVLFLGLRENRLADLLLPLGGACDLRCIRDICNVGALYLRPRLIHDVITARWV